MTLNEAQAISLLIGAVTTSVVGIGTLGLQVMSYFASRRRDVKISEVHDMVNGQSTALNAAIGASARAEGRVEGIASERKNPQRSAKVK